jgi:hypothetical protein
VKIGVNLPATSELAALGPGDPTAAARMPSSSASSRYGDGLAEVGTGIVWAFVLAVVVAISMAFAYRCAIWGDRVLLGIGSRGGRSSASPPTAAANGREGQSGPYIAWSAPVTTAQ